MNAVFSTHTFRYSFNVSSEVVGICKGVRVMVIVPSQPDRFKTREVMRATWVYDKVGEWWTH